jgi:hypothetical protein
VGAIGVGVRGGGVAEGSIDALAYAGACGQETRGTGRGEGGLRPCVCALQNTKGIVGWMRRERGWDKGGERRTWKRSISTEYH